jgi:hypothetical protein
VAGQKGRLPESNKGLARRGTCHKKHACCVTLYNSQATGANSGQATGAIKPHY